MKKYIIALVVVIGVLFLLRLLGVGKMISDYAYYINNRVCVKSHSEQYIQPPLSVVVGGGKNGGGIAIPIGDSVIKTRTICDEYNNPIR